MKNMFDSGRTDVEIGQIIGRTSQAIKSKRHDVEIINLKPGRPKRKNWNQVKTEKQIQTKMHFAEPRKDANHSRYMDSWMRRELNPWTRRELNIIKTRFNDGFTDEEIASELGRTKRAIQHQRLKSGLKRKRGGEKNILQQAVPKMASPKEHEPTKGAKYTRYMKPSTEVSILWGLIKYTKG